MADISKITTLDGTTYDIKAYKLKTARTINVGNYATGTATSFDGSANITIPVNSFNTQGLTRPTALRGLADNTLQTLVSTTRANRLAFLPADQIIIEQTVDGGTTWTDAGVSDANKVALFSETRPTISLPRINGTPNILCGIRITITGMKYNVPDGTTETQKYNYWNSTYVNKTERYCQLKELYFWLSSTNNSIGVKVQRATGANPNTWDTIFNDSTYYMTGWSGCDYLRFSQSTFGGSTNQTGNYWNYRIILMTLGKNGSTTEYGTSDAALSVFEIRAYGDTVWTIANQYMANDHIYSKDSSQNATFPANVTATSFTGSLTGNASTATKATQDESGNNIKASYASSISISENTLTLKNKNGASLSTATIPTELPAVTSSDNGKVLRVVNGAWAAAQLPSASGVSF